MRHQAAKVRHIRERDGDVVRELHDGSGFTGRPRAQDLAGRIVERGGDRMLPPEARAIGGAMALVRFLAPRHGVSMTAGGWAHKPAVSHPRKKAKRLPSAHAARACVDAAAMRPRTGYPGLDRPRSV